MSLSGASQVSSGPWRPDSSAPGDGPGSLELIAALAVVLLLTHLLLAQLTLLLAVAFYLIGPFFNLGTKMEPLTALGISGVWGLYGAIYFMRASKSKGKTVLLETKSVTS